MVNASNTNEITYVYHDYGNSDLSSCTPYPLQLENVNNVVAPCTLIEGSDFVNDSDTSVVKIKGPGGTGFIIGKHTIVTAAHCVYHYSDSDSDSDSEFIDFTVQILDSNSNLIEEIEPKFVHVPILYTEGSTYGNDYAMIEVQEDLSEYGMFKLGVPLENYRGQVTVSGFSSLPNVEWGTRYKAQGNVTEIHYNSIWYFASANGGCSGGPVYVESNHFGETYKTVIGINTYEGGTNPDNGNPQNGGVNIDENKLKFYYSNNKIQIRG